MPVTLLKTKDTESALHFPLGGVNVVSAFGKQPNVPIDQSIGWYARTTPAAMNVRAFDQEASKARGGSRPGLSRYIDQQMPGVIGNLGLVVINSGDPVQSSSSGRLVTGVAVCNGHVRIFHAGDNEIITPTNGNNALISSGVVFSAANGGKLFFADGVNKKFFDPAENAVKDWVLTAGEFPSKNGDLPRLIATYRGRTVLSGIESDPQNWWMSRQGDPFDFDPSPLSATPIQAVIGNNSPLGLIGDVVTTLIAFTDDMLIFGGDHTIWSMQGDPLDGGRLVNVSEGIGMAWGVPWCNDPRGNIYFFSNHCGIYRLDPTDGRPQPIRISDQIDPLLAVINTGANTISMVWDNASQGLHVFVTRTAGPYRQVHLFWEARTNGWFPVRFADRMHNPLCCCTFDGNTPDDRVSLIGSWDGYVRWLNPAATTDDSVPIESSVVIGPLLTNDLDQVMLTEMQAVLAEQSGTVTYEVFTGTSAEKALVSKATLKGVFRKGRNFTVPVARSGYAIYVKLSATTPWAMESIRVAMRGLGPVARRGA